MVLYKSVLPINSKKYTEAITCDEITSTGNTIIEFINGYDGELLEKARCTKYLEHNDYIDKFTDSDISFLNVI